MDEINSHPGEDMENALKRARSRVGCSTLTFKDMPLIEALGKIFSRGFTAVDIGVIPSYCCHIDPDAWTEKDSAILLQTLALRQMRISSLNVSVDDLYSLYDEEPWNFIEKCIKIAAQVGAYTVTIPPGPAVRERD